MSYKFTDLQEAWLRALESGEYKQAMSCLNDNEYYCCLGIACEVFLKEGGVLNKILKADDLMASYDEETLYPPDTVWQALGLKSRAGDIDPNPYTDQSSLVFMNDSEMPHKDIAKFIREHPELVFDQSK